MCRDEKPSGRLPAVWKADLKDIADKLTETCRSIDPTSTEQTIKMAHAIADVVEGEEHAQAVIASTLTDTTTEPEEQAFGAGLLEE